MTGSRLLAVLLAAAAALAGCDKPKPRHADRRPPPVSARPLPALPAWAGELLGQRPSDAFPGALATCVGNADGVTMRYGGDPTGVEISGWGWDPSAKAPVGRIVLVDLDYRIVGAGEGGVPRPGVPTVMPQVTSADTGWTAHAARAKGPLDAYGIVGGGQALCRLGHLEF